MQNHSAEIELPTPPTIAETLVLLTPKIVAALDTFSTMCKAVTRAVDAVTELKKAQSNER